MLYFSVCKKLRRHRWNASDKALESPDPIFYDSDITQVIHLILLSDIHYSKLLKMMKMKSFSNFEYRISLNFIK